MGTHGYQTYNDDHFTMYANAKSGTIPETNKILYVNYTSIKKKKELFCPLT